jgi:hypothetical protein
MPPTHLLCQRASPQPFGESGLIRRTATLARPTGRDVSYSLTLFDGDHHLAMSYTTWTDAPGERSRRWREHVGVWNLRSGDLLATVEPTSPYPEEVSDDPEPVGLFATADLLVTDREAVLEIWRISTGDLVQRIPFATESPFQRLEQTDGGWSCDRVSSPDAYDAVLLDNGTKLGAWLSNRQAHVVWDLPTGREVSAEADTNRLNRAVPARRTCGELELTSDLVLRSESGDMRLFPRGAYVSPCASPTFSSDCALVALTFYRRPSFLSFRPDVTPTHLRVLDARSGELVTWTDAPDGRVLTFLPGSLRLLATAGDCISIIDCGVRREIARVALPSPFHGVEAFGDGFSMLLVRGDSAEVWRCEPAP